MRPPWGACVGLGGMGLCRWPESWVLRLRLTEGEGVSETAETRMPPENPERQFSRVLRPQLPVVLGTGHGLGDVTPWVWCQLGGSLEQRPGRTPGTLCRVGKYGSQPQSQTVVRTRRRRLKSGPSRLCWAGPRFLHHARFLSLSCSLFSRLFDPISCSVLGLSRGRCGQPH